MNIYDEPKIDCDSQSRRGINSLLKKARFPLSCCWHSAERESDAWA
jgi:hypothetical protein